MAGITTYPFYSFIDWAARRSSKQEESPAGITPNVAGFGSDRNRGRVDAHHVKADFATGVRQPVVADVNSLLVIP
jgi:hypothetical protein